MGRLYTCLQVACDGHTRRIFAGPETKNRAAVEPVYTKVSTSQGMDSSYRRDEPNMKRAEPSTLSISSRHSSQLAVLSSSKSKQEASKK
jgi:hypothetical protein